MSTEAERFWAKVGKSDGCWDWTASRTLADGYGRFRTSKNELVVAHRWSYIAEHGPIPAGLRVDHVCHNPCCVRPAHLRLATQKQNQENRGALNRNNTTGIRGVGWSKKGRCWRAHLVHEGKQIGRWGFSSAADAEAWVTAKRLELFTHNDLDRISA